MAQLTDVPEIDQNDLQDVFRYSIDSGTNVLILGPSGGGKTEMCFSVIEEKKCRAVYINMAVLERTDFQGMPVISDDKTLVSYATPEFLPFSDTKAKNKRSAYNTLIKWINKQPAPEGKAKKGLLNKDEAIELIQAEIQKLEEAEEIKNLKKSLDFLPANELATLKAKINALEVKQDDDTPIVIMFDEVDKGLQEVLQTLLEFLQFNSINGRKLNIKTCIMTGNLPDEFAHTNQISHAITKRGLTFKLKLNFDLWRTHAVKRGVSHLITGFLSQHSDYLYKTPKDGDDTQYALPSPRTWVMADKIIKFFEKNEKFNINNDTLRLKLISGAVGEIAAIQFNNWHKHYYQLDPFINDLMNKGTFPNVSKPDMTTEDIFICALSACAKLETALKPDNKDMIEKYVNHAFTWLGTLPPDVQIGSIRMVFGGNFDNSKGHEGIISKYKLSELPQFTKVFINIHENMQKWEKLNAERSKELSA